MPECNEMKVKWDAFCPGTLLMEIVSFAVFWIGQLAFASVIFVMTMSKVWSVRRQYNDSRLGGILEVMFRDELHYFLVIFIANLTNVLTYALAPLDDKFINAPFTDVRCNHQHDGLPAHTQSHPKE
ncbi:hypothetical protein EW145_g3908 [Phellinidium pouzarii]|uniref:Uncharacterized protein n=1 Tax=Phellinidium pouzarii TaxID=167371 RepID=A0A4S4L5M9_9AGAM|nr:hypothetical protein EW145_g3908 [Phellinidium pouzarii]